MNPPFSGGCACGAIRYRCAAAPVAMLNCHCQDCQRSSGAPFASGVISAPSWVCLDPGSPHFAQSPQAPAQ